MNIRRKVIISILFLSISLSNFNILNAKGTLGTNELNLENNELPEYIKINPKDKLTDERLNKFLREMYKKRMNGTYTYKGERQSDKVFDPNSTNGNNVSNYYEYNGKMLLNPCDPPGIWDTLPERKYRYVRQGKCANMKSEEIYNRMINHQNLKDIMASPFSLRFNIYDPTPIFGIEYWNQEVERRNGNKTIRTYNTIDANGNLIPSKEIHSVNATQFYKYLVKEIYKKSSDNARNNKATINPDYFLLNAKWESGLNTNSGAQANILKNNFYGYAAFNKKPSNAKNFTTVDESIDFLINYLSCSSLDSNINKHCVGGGPDNRQHNYNNSIMGVETSYSGSFCETELNNPYSKAHSIIMDIEKILKQLNKYDEIVGKIDCKNKSDESAGKKVIRNGQVLTDK